MADVSPTVVAGAIAGGAALVVFVVVHAIWIVPIWGMLSMIPIASLVGALAAWAFDEISARGGVLPAPFDGLAFSAILLSTLAPTVVFGMFAGPVDMNDISVPAVVIPLVLAAPAGAAIGMALGGSERAALALGLAALALAITIGHNLPFFPIGAPSWEKAFALVVGVELSAGVAFSLTRVLMSAGGMGEIAR